MNNKKLLSIVAIVLVMVCFTTLMVGCKAPQEYEVNFFMPDGTPALAAVSVLNEFAFEETTTNFNIVKADQIQGVFNAGADIAIMPTIVAAKLYNNGQAVKLVSVNVFGNLFIVGVNSQVQQPQDMVGKVLYVTVGTTLQLTKYILAQNDIQFEEGAEAIDGKVVLNSKADGSEIMPLLKQASNQSKEALAVLGEPQVTKAKSVVGQSLAIAIDLQQEWKDITGFDGYPQASLVATQKFCEEHADYIKYLVGEMDKNAQFISQNLTSLSDIFARYESSLAGMTLDAVTIQNCNLRVQKASDAKSSVQDYLQRLSATVDDGFFFNF